MTDAENLGFTPKPCFSVPIWARQIRDADTLNKPIRDNFDQLAKAMKNAPRSTVDGWQSDTKLHLHPTFRSIAEMIGRNGAACAQTVGFDRDHFDLVLAEMWINKTVSGQYHRTHTHPNRFLSGVYYVQVPDGAGAIEFTDPIAARVNTAPPLKTSSDFYPQSIKVEPKEGMIVLFPAWLAHSVGPTHGETPRLSVSFNFSYRPKP